MKICEWCGEEFAPIRSSQKYCCYDCGVKASNDRRKKSGEKVCTVCGKTFTATHGGLKYCSDECRAKLNAAKSKENYEKKKREFAPRACLHCGKEFIPNSGPQKFCCRDCSNKHRHTPKNEVGIKVCIVCGKEFDAKAFNQKFCCEDCKWEFHRKNRKYECRKNEGIEVKPKKKKKKYTTNEWNNLTPSERWELMAMNDVLRENLKYHIPTYGKSETMARWGKLPEDYGKRERKK